MPLIMDVLRDFHWLGFTRNYFFCTDITAGASTSYRVSEAHSTVVQDFTSDRVAESSSQSDSNSGYDYGDTIVHSLSSFVSPNINDPITLKKSFWKQHPIQVTELQGKRLPFEPSKLYYRTLPNGEKIKRKWLSYSVELNKVFCASCMAFGDKDHRESLFVTGHDVLAKHIYKAIEVHENARSHQDAVTAALQSCCSGDIDTLLSSNLV